MTDTQTTNSRQDVYLLVGLLAALTVLVVWCYWNSLAIAAATWTDAQYSHGWLIPIFAVALLWLRGAPYGISAEAFRSNTWGDGLIAEGGISVKERVAGFVIMVVGLGGRLYCADRGFEVPDMVTMVPALLGAVLMVGGWRVLKWAGPAIIFLGFMFPLPWRVERSVLVPLQGVATGASTFVLQTLGFAAFREGNTINLGESQLNVIDQCSGLRMLTIFVALSFAIALVIDRPIWERIFILLSAVPIALAVNVARITITGMMHVAFHDTQYADLANKFFHDFAGWVMMPMAMILLFLECVLLQQIFVTSDTVAEPVMKKKREMPARRSRRGQRRRSAQSGKPGGGSASTAQRESKIHREPKGHPEWATPKQN